MRAPRHERQLGGAVVVVHHAAPAATARSCSAGDSRSPATTTVRPAGQRRRRGSGPAPRASAGRGVASAGVRPGGRRASVACTAANRFIVEPQRTRQPRPARRRASPVSRATVRNEPTHDAVVRTTRPRAARGAGGAQGDGVARRVGGRGTRPPGRRPRTGRAGQTAARLRGRGATAEQPGVGRVHAARDQRGDHHLDQVAGDEDPASRPSRPAPTIPATSASPAMPQRVEHHDAADEVGDDAPVRAGTSRPPRSVSQPTTYAATGQPSRKPDRRAGEHAESAARRRRAAAGPTATSTRSSTSDRKPRRAPRIAPASITPSDCAVIGTENPGGVNTGTRPSAATTPVKVATRARSRGESCAVRGRTRSRGHGLAFPAGRGPAKSGWPRAA